MFGNNGFYIIDLSYNRNWDNGSGNDKIFFRFASSRFASRFLRRNFGTFRRSDEFAGREKAYDRRRNLVRNLSLIALDGRLNLRGMVKRNLRRIIFVVVLRGGQFCFDGGVIGLSRDRRLFRHDRFFRNNGSDRHSDRQKINVEGSNPCLESVFDLVNFHDDFLLYKKKEGTPMTDAPILITERKCL